MASEAELHAAREALESELRTRQEAFIKKERVYKTKIDLDEKQLNSIRAERTAWMQNDGDMLKLRGMHQQILQDVKVVQTRTAKLVQEQEHDLLRAFRARLLDVQMELEKEKSDTDDGAAAWIERSRHLEMEVDREKDRADKLDRVNHTQARENQLLKQQFQTQEDDRTFLVKQLVVVKKKNQLLRNALMDKQTQLAATRKEMGLSAADDLSSTLEDRSSLGSLDDIGFDPDSKDYPLPRQEADSRYREIIKRITKMLDVERRHRKQVQSALDAFRATRTPLEISLQQSVDATLRETEEQPTGVGRPRTGSQGREQQYRVDAFNSVQRERVLERWLALDGTVEALCEFGEGATTKTQNKEGSEALSSRQHLGEHGLQTPGSRGLGVGRPGSVGSEGGLQQPPPMDPGAPPAAGGLRPQFPKIE